MKEFKELYGLHSKDLFNYLYYLTNDSSLAEELVQETFYQAFKSIHRFHNIRQHSFTHFVVSERESWQSDQSDQSDQSNKLSK